jgi:tetratricopeptide (TPR) repeat protein/TolB-like protein
MLRLKQLIHEIHRRSLWQVLGIYVVGGWIALQIVDTMAGALKLPDWAAPIALVLLIIGLPIVLATAFVQEGMGSRATGEVETTSGGTPIPSDVPDEGARHRLFTWRNAILGGVVAFALLFGFAGLYVLLQDRGQGAASDPPAAGDAVPRIAVLPFHVVGPESDPWSVGLLELLATNLDGVAGVHTIDPRTILARWHDVVGETGDARLEQALEVASGTGARYALTGSMVTLGGEVRLSAQLFDLESGEPRGEPLQVKGDPDGIPGLVDRLSIDILAAGFGRSAADLPQFDLRQVTTDSLAAMRAYLTGEHLFTHALWREAIPYFVRAVEEDSLYASALYRLSLAKQWEGSPHSPRSDQYQERATRVRGRLTSRDSLLLKGYTELSNWRPAAVPSLLELTRLHPDDVDGWFLLGDAYFHNAARWYHPPEAARTALERAVELAPGFGPAYVHLIEDAFSRLDSVAARDLIERLTGIDPSSPEAVGDAIAYALVWGDEVSRQRALASMDTVSPDALLNAKHALQVQPDLWEPALAVATTIVDREDAPLDDRASALGGTNIIYTQRGRIREARQADLRTIEMRAGDATRAESGFYWRNIDPVLMYVFLGYPDPELAEHVSAFSEPASLPPDWVYAADGARFALGALAASEGRWLEVDDHARALASLSEKNVAEGDTARIGLGHPPGSRSQWQAGLAAFLRGYAAALKGDHAAAIPLLEEAIQTSQHLHAWRYELVLARFELGKLLLESGDAEEAERYFRSFDPNNTYFLTTPREVYLGMTYEALGDPEAARLHYANFIRWWEDADPELQPLVEEATTRLFRLRDGIGD